MVLSILQPRAGPLDGVLVNHSITGIDVSAFQPRIDWPQVAAAGHAFAFIKFTEGNGWVSKIAKAQWHHAKAVGLLRGPYHFARWDTDGDPVLDALDEARGFYDVVGPLAAGDLPPVLDLEWIRGEKRDPDELALWALTFLAECERLFVRLPIIYTGPSFWRYCLLPDRQNRSLELTRYILWQVDYNNSPPTPMRGVDWPWTFWQHTGKGRCTGITDAKGRPADVDLNKFAGTIDDLRELAALPRLGGLA